MARNTAVPEAGGGGDPGPTSAGGTASSSSRSLMPLTPAPPLGPKPANLVTQRHKFVNHSVASLPTTVGTRDCLSVGDLDTEEFRGDCNASDNSSDTSGGGSDGEGEEEGRSSKRSFCHRDEGSPGGASSSGAAALATVEELHELEEVEATSGEVFPDSFHSEATSGEVFPGSFHSEPCLDDADDPSVPREPLLKIEEGIRPASELPRCPPISWLSAAGFEVPSSKGFDAAPVAPVCGERPTRYLNMFCRQMLARQQTSDFTVGALARHEAASGRSRHTDPDPAERGPGVHDGEWLEAFLARARAVPLQTAARSVIGSDIGHSVAGFLDGLSDTSSAGASIDCKDAPDGLHVTGHKIMLRPCQRGRGRVGFYVDSDAGISTPGRSQSPPPRRLPPPLPVEAPTAPLIHAAGAVPPAPRQRHRPAP